MPHILWLGQNLPDDIAAPVIGIGELLRLISNPLVFGLAVLVPLVLILVGNLVSALKSAARLAKEEEEAAVRQALEELKAKQNAAEK